jgi:hypothetical protein
MYARTEPAKVHAILARFGATHAILEDSICLAKKEDGCGTPSIMDVVNGEVRRGGRRERIVSVWPGKRTDEAEEEKERGERG